MKTWPVQDAKARFSELLDRCIADGPKIVTRRGAEAAVPAPIDRWRRLERHGAQGAAAVALLSAGALKPLGCQQIAADVLRIERAPEQALTAPSRAAVAADRFSRGLRA